MTYVMRPARPDDLEAMYEMAKLTGGGFTNLPANRPALEAKLARSAEAISRTSDELADDLFVLVLEDAETGAIRGTCQIFSRVGMSWPFYSYRITSHTAYSRELDRTFRNQSLQFVTDLEGSSEVGGLFLHPSARAGGLGLLLARSRYLFIAMHRARFADRLLAELRGIVDGHGNSPFWDGVAGRFFGMSFREADDFNALNGNQFIADLMPRHPIYTAMISDDARAAIGVPHESGRPAMRMLEDEGFAWENYIDIFDGGPTMTIRTDSVKTIAASQRATVDSVDPANGRKGIVATGHLADFRCCLSRIQANEDGSVAIEARARQALCVAADDSVCWATR
ncbi:arginine N-succinyltransferase [Croceicoccus naphthovorans]|uniref:Arginine N-succinyltransferase n=1 Tax=Croceicoccus naphthovorans TaxID=1348774 RepID=A0A0G3XCA4_9SPHN|nr:arginine N-succinyltransferase [Croceicoccus naphthovorans]AKM09175.1 arginine N-succinyltransferase [Croceicoccus naphthovorans]MBB3990457.1 arginine N-succinyltransferase [Croceicoccus naphthovorans]